MTARSRARDFTYSSATRIPHHDFARLPNGNILLITTDKIGEAEAIAAGRNPASVEGSELHADSLVEIRQRSDRHVLRINVRRMSEEGTAVTVEHARWRR